MIIAWLQLVVTFFVGSAYMASRAGGVTDRSFWLCGFGYRARVCDSELVATEAYYHRAFCDEPDFSRCANRVPGRVDRRASTEAESAIEVLSHGRFSESAKKTYEASWNFTLDLWRAVIFLVNLLLAFLHSVFHNQYPWILNWAWYLFTATAFWRQQPDDRSYIRGSTLETV